jgi:hypothetical protein
MITTVAEFLEQLREKEARILAKHDVSHAPTIGSMYEGLTKDLLGRAIPPNLGLAATSGFVVDSQGNRSKQIDCMITCAPGTGIPYTDEEDVLIEDVTAVIEVKKNLYSDDLRSGYDNLASLRQLDAIGAGRSGELLRDAFQGITRFAYPENEEQLHSYPYEIQLVFHSLAVDNMYPARVIFGYGGFATENGLRESFASFIERSSEVNPAKGFGPARLPWLICCDSHMLFKVNGMPFHQPLQDDGFWPIYASRSGNPLEMLLEFIWTRLSYEGRLPGDIFEGSDPSVNAHRFLDVRPEKISDGWGWRYRYVGELPQALEGYPERAQWEPATIDEIQQAVLVKAGQEGHLDLLDSSVLRDLAENGYTAEGMADALNKLGLAARVGDRLVLLTRECVTAMLPDGRIVAGENSSGQLDRWVAAQITPRAHAPRGDAA